MFDDELKRVKKKVGKLIQAGKLQNKNICLFGASDNSRQIVTILREYNLQANIIIDNDTKKQGSYFCGRKVVSFEDVSSVCCEKNIFLIYSAFWREMYNQLINSSVKEKNIVLLFGKRKTLLEHIIDAYIGKRIFNKIRKEYNSLPVFLCPYTGTGDVYLIGAFWKQYCEKYGIQDYVFIVISNACKKVAMLFDIKNIIVLKTKAEMKYLIDAHMLVPKEVPVKLLNDCWAQIHTNQIEWFRGYKGLYFTQVFRKFVFNLPDRIKPEHPEFKDVSDRVNKIFEEHNLIKYNTVILSPYSNTLSDLPKEFWCDLADNLKKRGFVVCTNSCGKSEPAIDGTIPVFFPLDIAPQFMENAGYFIGVRSGFCDVVSGAKAKKVILYDKNNRFYMSSAFEYFNLKEMELCDDAVEIEFYADNFDMIISDVLKEIEREN